MTPDSQPQSQQTHGSQPETQKPKKQSRFDLSPIKKCLRNAVLGTQTKEELKEQVKEKIQALIISENIKSRLNQKLEKEFIKIQKDLQKRVVDDLEKKYKRLRGKIYLFFGIALTFSSIVGVLTFFGSPLIGDILTLDVLKSDIETLKEDVEDIEDLIQN